MSEKSDRKKYINISSIKINKISLLNQSNFNTTFKKLFIPKSKINEISGNNKILDKPYEIFFSPIQNLFLNTKVKENNNKSNPLTEKNKIIKKHNILKKIDFNINPLKNNSIDNNIKSGLNLYNNYNNNLYICNDISNLYSNINNNNFYLFNNRSNLYDNNNIYNNYNEKSINFPLLTYSNKELFQNTNKIKNNSNIHKNTKTPISINNFMPFNITSTSIKCLNILKKCNKKFNNKKIRNTQNIKKLKQNYTEKSIYKKLSFSFNKENNKKQKDDKIKINTDKKEKIKNDDNNEESSSYDDYCDFKEIEKIISKPNLTIKNQYKKNIFNKNKKIFENKDKFIFLNSLYISKNKKINKRQDIEPSKTTHNIFSDIINYNKISKINIGNNSERRNRYLNKNINIFNHINNIQENNNLNDKKNIQIQKNLMTYDYKNKNIKTNKLYKLFESKKSLK